MATTTPSFSWPVPTSSDLVKNGATAIEALGDAIDASMTDLKGGTTGQVLAKATNTDMDFTWTTSAAGMTNPMTTTGDTIYSSSGSTPARLGIGSSGQVLTVAGGVPTWATPSGGGGSLTQLGTTTTLSGTSTTVSFTATSYKNLYVQIDSVNPASAVKLDVQPNAVNNIVDVVSQRAIAGLNLSEHAFDSYIRLVRDQIASGNTANSFSLLIYNVSSTSAYKPFTAVGGYQDDSFRRSVETMGGIIKTNSAISSLLFQGSGSGYSGGTVKVYGVN
jgi:hypothetical protein